MVNIAVVGAGAVGLSTAVNIQRRIPGCRITIIADKFGEDTLSAGAAGIYLSRTSTNDTYPEPAKLRKWREDSFLHYSTLALSADSADAGCFVNHGYLLSNKERMTVDKDLTLNSKELSQDELKMLKLPYRYGTLVTGLITECKRYLPWLMKEFKSNGGQVRHETIRSLEELAGQYDIAVNCTGYNSKTLVGDDQIVPIRGQVFRVRAPWIRHWIYDNDNVTYIIPGADNAVVGGTKLYGNASTHVDPGVSTDIWERACKLWPPVKNAKIEFEWVGLRPHRKTIRIEKERMQFGNSFSYVVHNYGHGDQGVMLSWGTAVEATTLVTNCVKELSTVSKL